MKNAYLTPFKMRRQTNWRLPNIASVAQSVEHVLGKDGVGGSNPL